MDKTSSMTIFQNGVKYVETFVPGKLIYIEVFVDVGWDDESTSTNGICHFLEHMNAAFTSEEYPDATKNRKIFDDYGVNSNAYTSSKTCGYHVEVHCSKSIEVIRMFIQSIVNFKLDHSILLEEANSIKNELRSGYVDSVWYDFETEWAKTCFKDHIRSVEIRDQVNNVDYLLRAPDKLLEWRATHYCPSNMTVTLAGDPTCSEWNQVRQMVTDAMRGITPLPPRAPRSYEESLPEGRKDIHLEKVTSSKIRFFYPLDIVSKDHHAKLCIETWRKIIVKGLSSRLYKLRYENDGMIYGVFVRILVDKTQPRLSGMYIETTCKPVHVDLICKRVQEELSYPPTLDELERVKHITDIEDANADYLQSASKFGRMYGQCAHLHGGLLSNSVLRQAKRWMLVNARSMFAGLIEFWKLHPPFVMCGHPSDERVG